MLVDIFQSVTNKSKFLSAPVGADLTKIDVADPDYANVKPFKMGRKVTETDNTIAYDSVAAIGAIEADGYYLHSFTSNL